MSSSGKVKFGVIGCSRIAKKAVIPAIIDSKNAEIGIIGSRSAEKAREFCGMFGLDSCGSYDDVLKSREINAVYISLPVGLHEEWVIRAARAGKHVLCEKSSTVSFESAKKMVGECKKNGVRLMEGFMFRYHPQHKEVLGLVKKGMLGNLVMFEGFFGFPFPAVGDPKLSRELGGGSLNDSAAYPIYASRMFFGEPESVFCRLVMDRKRGIDAKASLFLDYPDGKSAFIGSAFGAYFQSTYSLLGTKARISMKRAYAVPKGMRTSIFIDKEDKISRRIIGPEDHFRLMVEDFCTEISGKRKKRNFEEDLLSQARVMEAARVSGREGRLVRLSEI